MAERRFTDEEVAAIFAAATEEPAQSPHPTGSSSGLTLTQIQEIGREVGIAPEAIARAVSTLPTRSVATTRRFLGLPLRVERSVALERWLSESEWEALVVELRTVFQAKGKIASSGNFREWTNGNLQVLLEPSSSGHVLRLRTLKGDAQALLNAGTASIGVAAAMTVALAMGGRLSNALPGIALMILIGLGMAGGAAIRVFPWARERSRQMDDIIARLLSPPTPPPA